jgi:hypothetical protein
VETHVDLFILLVWTAQFSQKGYAVRLSPIHLPLEEVAVHAAHGALMEVDDTSALIVGDLKGIFGQQLELAKFI